MEITLTKKSVKKVMPKLYSVVLNLSCEENGIEILNCDFSENYRTGQNIAEIVNRFRTKMQDTIGTYKEENQIFSATQLDTAITTLKNSLVG